VTGASSHSHAPSVNSTTTSAAAWTARRGLADPADARQGDERAFAQKGNEPFDLAVTADERGHLTREVVRQRVQGPQRRELGTEPGIDHLQDMHGTGEVPQVVLAEVPQRHPA
jgi:hypothetical protein